MGRVVICLVWILGAAAVAALDSPRPTLLLVKDQPWLAWSERRGSVSEGRVARWNGSSWVSVGSPLNRQRDQSVASVALALAPDGTVWAAWGEKPPRLEGKDVGSGLLHVAFWTGAEWKEPAPSPSRSTRTVSERPLLAIDAQGRPWVSWSEITPDFNVDNVYLACLDGSWKVVDNGTLTTDVSSAGRSRDLVLLPDGKPLLAWSWMVYRHDFQVFVGPWDGRRWSRWGGRVNSDGERWAGFPSLKLDARGRPVVGYLQAGRGGFRLEVKRWNGSGWDDLGFPPAPGARSPQLVLAAGEPVVASVEPGAGLVVRRGVPWKELGRVSTPGAFVDTLSLAADSRGVVWVAWAEDDAKGQRLGLARWGGAKWERKATPEYRPR